MFLYSQDLSNYKTVQMRYEYYSMFLYSQDLSNYKTVFTYTTLQKLFLYSQDLSNYKTLLKGNQQYEVVFVLSRFK